MKTLLKRLILLIFILILWGIASQNVNELFVPSPNKVFADLVQSIENGSLLIAIRYSFLRITIASFISMLIAVPIALLSYNVTLINDIIGPIVAVMRYLPVTAFYPLLIMWFGIDETMKIVFLCIATFVYMMPSVILCLDEIDEELIDTGYTIGMTRLQAILQIQVPASLPSIINSFIMMYGIGFTYIAVAETINARHGLGYIIQQSSSRGRTDLVFMAILVIVVISIIFDTITKTITRRVFKWRYLDEQPDTSK